ncbi:MAG TPA: hypothetical protein ENO07_04420, partial [candidate division Zixibacteria bacterium]|nr:hypothetical protein [candidate division Zixibacteria bacterium]
MERLKENAMNSKHSTEITKIKFLLALLPLILLFAPTREIQCGELSSSLHGISPAMNDARIQVLVFLEDDGVSILSKSSSNYNHSRSQLHKELFTELKSRSNANINRFEGRLRDSDLPADVIRTFWITSAALIDVPVAELDRLAGLEGVEFVAPDTTLALIDPVSISMSSEFSEGASEHLYSIGADKLWRRGLTGKGRIVGSFDTGVEGSHPALNSAWRGNSVDGYSSAWFDPYGSTFPFDDNGHGTHTMGIMVGLDGSDTIGIAFNAEWISAGVIDRGSGLSQTISDILAAFEWAADPDGDPNTISDVPDVICHSWGIPQSIFPPCDNTFWSAIDNLESLGIVCVFAAGNEGPDSMSLRVPADRASGPLNAFSVGAIDQTDPNFVVAAFSSRGPSSCDNSRTKPEVVAPGVSIRSSYKGGTYRTISGTSMAAPIVAGAVALLREYNPEATSEQIKQAIFQSAVDLGARGADNSYGNGLIDLEAALALIPPPDSPHIQISSFVAGDGNDDIFESSEIVDLTLNVISQYASINSLWARIFIADEYARVLTDSAYFGYLESDQEGNNSFSPFVIQLSEQVRPGGRMPVDIDFYDVNGEVINAGRIEIVVGQSQNAVFHTLSNGSFKLTVDNFGGIGHGENSPSPAGVIGFSPVESEFDILPEFSLMIATGNDARVSDASRSETEFISDNDFLASREMEAVFQNPGSFGAADLFGYYSDSLATEPLGVSIRQRTSIFDDPELENCVIIEYSILPENGLNGDLYYLGFLMDWDLADGGGGVEQSAFDVSGDFCYFYNQDDDLYVGLRFLNKPVYGYKILPNIPGGKSLLSESSKYQHLTSGEINGGVEKWTDYFSIISARETYNGSGD